MRRALSISLASVALLAGLAHAQTVEINSNVNTSQVWGPTGTIVGDIFWVRSSISIAASATLEIEPGVVVKFDPFTSLVVNGRLRAAGTSVSNIHFTSIRDDNAGFYDDTNGDGNLSAPAASNWGGILFPDGSPDNSLISYCQVGYAGYPQQGALFFDSATDSVVNSVIRSSYYGIECRGNAAPVIGQTSIQAATLTPITLDFTAAPVLDAVVFSSSDNGYDAFGLRGGTLTTSATLTIRGATVGATPISNVTYVLLSGLQISPSGSLTIDPGVVIKPLGSGITVDGNLTMNGTALNQITITSIHDDNFGQPLDTNNNGSLSAPGAGNWSQIDFSDGSTGSVQYCRLKFGYSGMVRMTNESIGISNTLLSDAQHGIDLRGTSAPVLNTVTFQNSSSTPILMSASADPTFTNLTFISSGVTALGIAPENLSVDARLYPRTVAGFSNITYVLLDGFLTMQSGAKLTLDPGVVLKLRHQGGGAGLDIHGSLVADGKPESLIVFTSFADDLAGNPADTNGDGSISGPTTGDWSYIRYGATSDDGTSKLDYCRISYGSGFSAASLWITSAAPSITRCTISNAIYGVLMDGNASPTIDNCSITNCNNAPFRMSILADPTLTNNSFASNGVNGISLLSETLSQNATLEYRPGVGSPPFAYVPSGQITVGTGVTLSIEPRVVIKPAFGGVVFVVDGALNAVGGTGSDRIVLTSIRDDAHAGDTNADGSASSPGTGQAGVLQFNNTSVDASCIVRNVLFQFGGDGVITTVSASPRIARSEFFESQCMLMATGSSQPSLDSLTVLNCHDLPFKMSLVSDPVFGSAITLANNSYTAIGILGEFLSQDVRLSRRSFAGIPSITYALAGNMTIGFGAKWTIDPGIVLKLGPFGNGIDISGALIADGKPDSLIVFTSIKDDAFGGDTNNDGSLTAPSPGDWYNFRFAAVSDDANTILDHCRFRYGGGDFFSGVGAMQFTNAGPSLSNCVFTLSQRYAVLIEGNSTPVFTNCALDSSVSAPVRMSLVSDPAFNNVQFLGNGYTALSVVPETIAQDLLWKIRAVAGKDNIPYLIENQLTSGLGSTLTLQPGLIVKFAASGRINVQRAFDAEGGTPRDSMIVFTSIDDDFHGGDTDNNGTEFEPYPGSWSGVHVEGTAIDSEVRFRNCVFRYGGSGGGTNGALHVINSSPSVDSCLFAYNQVGVSAEGVSDPPIHGSSFVGNTSYAIRNHTSSFCIDAEGNWWGASSGPNDASSASDLCSLGSNAGAGNAVSDNVDYDPWLTTGSAVPALGDVSLNGEIRAFDASLVLQHVVSPSLSDLQKLVADVSGSSGITAFDASLILQYVAGSIGVFPAASSQNQPITPAIAKARALIASAQGEFTIALGSAQRVGDEWVVPVQVSGTAPIYSVEMHLAGGAASELISVAVNGSAMAHHAVGTDDARLAVAATAALPGEETLTLRFRATAEAWNAPALAWGRVNENETDSNVGVDATIPSLAFLGLPTPNPAQGAVSIALGISSREAGPVSIRILDLAGRRVRQVVDESLSPGVHRWRWDLRDARGGRVAPGIYLVHAEVGGKRFTRRLTVVR